MVSSLIIPMYNEENRLPKFLSGLDKFLQEREMEILLVNDGSSDNTLECMNKYAEGKKNVKIITYEKNSGKGSAIQKGVHNATGDPILFIDADGSISPDQIPKMLEKLKDFDMVVGDRSSTDSKIDQPLLRTMIGKIFNIYARILFQSNIKDNLCGFKGFKKGVAKDLFQDLEAKRWLFDVEIFYKAKKREYNLYRLPLTWEHKEESKIKPLDPIKMLFELLVLRYKLLKKEQVNQVKYDK